MLSFHRGFHKNCQILLKIYLLYKTHFYVKQKKNNFSKENIENIEIHIPSHNIFFTNWVAQKLYINMVK